jgi:hypothetical protein
MNILIEDAETQEYLASDGHWTKRPDEGASFTTSRGAYTAAKREPIGKFNIVWYFGDYGTIDQFGSWEWQGQVTQPAGALLILVSTRHSNRRLP